MAHTTSFPDIHIYDGKLDETFAAFVRSITKPVLTPLHRNALHQHFRQQLKDNPTQQKMLDMLLTDRTGNRDVRNNLEGDVLIDLCLMLAYRSPDFFSEFCIQLDDLVSGTCPQGRCTRMFQVLYAFYPTNKSTTN